MRSTTKPHSRAAWGLPLKRRTRLLSIGGAALVTATLLVAGGPAPAGPTRIEVNEPVPFQRIATFEVSGGSAEIVTASTDGQTLIYTDAPANEVGFVSIADPAAPTTIATLPTSGDPTSVAVTPDGLYALAVVDGTPDHLLVIRTSDRGIERSINLGGQPDSIAVSPNGRYAAVVIENQRDEGLDSGRMPQGPAGFLTIVDLVGAPADWTTRDVSLTGLAGMRFPTDPEPEYVDINAQNVAAVTLQENNHVALVDLPTGGILTHWTAGTVTQVADTLDNRDVRFANVLQNARREPDGIAWTPEGLLITANEGDYTVDLAPGEFAGGRGFTVFQPNGAIVLNPGGTLEFEGARHGHYPDGRSDAKGLEFENVEVGVYGGSTYAFINSERGHFVAVYRLINGRPVDLVQLLPTGLAPEGVLAIPQRNLMVTADEDSGTLSIYQHTPGGTPADYPQVYSPSQHWSAISGTVANGNVFHAVADSAFRPSRVYSGYIRGDKLTVTDQRRIAKSYDLEGIAFASGGFWMVSEGVGNAGAGGSTKNLLIRTNQSLRVLQEIQLPDSINGAQRQYGFEGVTTNATGTEVYVAFQREWADDPTGLVKIGRYTPATGEWRFFHYPINAAPPGGWVGLSEITRINDTTYSVIERDNQLGSAAQVKRVYTFSIAGLTPALAGDAPPVVTKQLSRDLLVQDNFRVEKAEGMMLTQANQMIIVSDNDGSGETRVVRYLHRP